MFERTRRTPISYLGSLLTVGVIGLVLIALLGIPAPAAQAAALTSGDVLVGQDNINFSGKVRQTRPNGSSLGVLDTTDAAMGQDAITEGEQTGMCFDAAGNLYTTNFLAFSMSKFSKSGALLNARFIDFSPSAPNSCAFDAAGNLYVGLSDADAVNGPGAGGGGLLKFDLSGPTPTLVRVYSPVIEGRGTDWIDLAPDQCTMLYTSVGSTIKRFDVCANPHTPPALSGQQLTDYCNPCDDGNGGPVGPFLAFRILIGGGGVLVTDNGAFTVGAIRRYDGDVATGTAAHARTYAGEDLIGISCGAEGDQACFFPFSLNLDPDGATFWSGDNITSEVFRFAIAGNGSPLTPPFCGADACDFFHFVTGVTVVGELTAATAVISTVAAQITAANKIYDGTTAATITDCTLTGVRPGDNVSCAASNGAFATPSAGTGKLVSATVSLTGSDASKYSLSSTTATTTADITPKPASVTPNATSKTYGAPDPTFTGTLSGFIASEGVSASYSRTAGESVAGGPYTISATLSPAAVLGNYAITYNTATFTIGKVNAAVSPNAASKNYGAADPTLTGSLSGFLASDNVSATYSRTAGESVAGSPYTITATLSPAGVLGNYNITYNTASFTITPVSASVTPNTASKSYGAPDPAFTGTLSGFLASDGVSATYSRTAGESVAGGPYTISATLSPAAVLSNYNVTYNTASFTITPVSASVTPNAASKTYGSADPALTGTLTGFLASDGVTASYSRTPGESVAGGPYTISATLSPAGALGNYSITYNTASFTITRVNASVTPNAASKTYNTSDPALTGTLTGFLGSDGVTATYSRTAGETVAGSPYLISAVLSPAAVLGNYNVTYNTASLTILKANASVTPNAASKVFGNPDPQLTGTMSGFSAADGVTASFSRTAGEGVAGSPYPIGATLSPAAVLGNYNVTYNTASFTITPATPVVTWTDPAAIVYPTPLSGVQLNATANVPGTFTYTPAAGTVLNPGNAQLLSVLLTPTDGDDYTTASAQVHITVLPSDVSVTETTSTPVVTAGDLAVYSLLVTSTATGSASGVVLSDTLPSGLDWTVGGADAGACQPVSPVAGGTNLTCNFGTLAPGATRAITLTATTSSATCGDLNNTASVSATGDTNAANNSSGPVTVTVNCPALSVSKSAGSPTISAGATARYDVSVTSGGTGDSTNVTLTDTLPTGLTWTVSGPDAAACSPAPTVAGGTTLTCGFGTLPAGTTKRIILTAPTTTANCGVINNTATVSAAADTTAGDNSAGPVAITVNCPDVSVALTTSTPSITQGSSAVYKVVVTGNGPGSASNVTLTDTLPSGLNWTVGGPDASACSPGSPVAGGMTLTCNFGTLAAGATKTITLTAVTGAGNCGVLDNTATVSAAGDTNAGNNSSGPVKIIVNCTPVAVTLSCPNVSLMGAAFSVSGAISPATPGALVTVQYTSPSGVNTSHVSQSGAGGDYSDTFTANEMGPWSIQASWNGATSPSCPVMVFGESGNGTFVIGDGNAVLNNAVDFWGAQWWKDNTLSGGVSPGLASFKGFADAVDLPANCGGSWSTRPGNSSHPPDSIPPYMAVIVSSSITKNGSTISGDVVGLVIVKTDPGYAGNPGHPGTGTITEIRCHK